MIDTLPNGFLSVFTFLFGLVFGSFLNVVIYRVPRELSVVAPRSACPGCRAAIRAYDNIPVVSWILLRGRCRSCRTPISPRYAIVELLCGFLFVVAYYYAAPLTNQLAILTLLKFCLFFFLLLGLIFIDFEHHLLPDVLTLPGVIVGLIFSIFIPVGGLPHSITRRLLAFNWPLGAISLLEALIGAGLGALFIYGVGEIYFRLRHIEGMGFGDVKLMAMVGAFFRAKLSLSTIFTVALQGSIFGLIATHVAQAHLSLPDLPSLVPLSWASARLILRYYEAPFGIFLGGMTTISTFIGNPISDWHLSFYR